MGSFLLFICLNDFINNSIIERNDINMSDISKFKSSDGVICNFKDNTAAGELNDAKGIYDSFSGRLDGYDTLFGKVSEAIQGLIDTRVDPIDSGNIRLTKSAGGVCKPYLNMIIKNTWVPKTWTGLTGSFNGSSVWTDGDNIYYSNQSNQYVLNKSTSTWSSKSWGSLTSFYGGCIWTDGENIYYSNGSAQYVLDKATSTWNTKTWNGLTSFSGQYVWTDGDNIYYSNYSTQYVLNKSTSTWSSKSWNGLTSFNGDYVWTDGDNIYYSYDPPGTSNQYVLDKSTSTWNTKTWSGSRPAYGGYIWTDGDNIYYSYQTYKYVLTQEVTTTNMPLCKP